MGKISLRWYRDRDRGQQAADTTGAEQTACGTWPMAVWPCDNATIANLRWAWLLDTFGVNAETRHEC
jgi:hypothetical protein